MHFYFFNQEYVMGKKYLSDQMQAWVCGGNSCACTGASFQLTDLTKKSEAECRRWCCNELFGQKFAYYPLINLGLYVACKKYATNVDDEERRARYDWRYSQFVHDLLL